MSWEAYYKKIIEAKEEYDRSVKPVMKKLERIHKQAWNRYLARITQAEIIFKEDSP